MADNYASGLVTIPAEWPLEAKLDMWDLFHVICRKDAPNKKEDESYTHYLLRIAGGDKKAKAIIKHCTEALEQLWESMYDDLGSKYELHPSTREEVPDTYVMTGCIEQFSPQVCEVVVRIAALHEVRQPQYQRAEFEIAWYCSALRRGEFSGENLFLDADGIHTIPTK